MIDNNKEFNLTGALEDYLETIYTLVRESKVARVKDIAQARGVRAASVTPAMKRLAELGLIHYVQREFIDLTPDGERAARRVYARHQILTRFFEEILRMSPEVAAEDACSMEHSLSPTGMEHLVRFFEFLRNCPDGRQFLAQFHRCALVHDDVTSCENPCPATNERRQRFEETRRSLDELAPGEQGRVTQVSGSSAHRRRLLEMGLLPDVGVAVARVDAAQDLMWIRLGGYEIELSRAEAHQVSVAPQSRDQSPAAD